MSKTLSDFTKEDLAEMIRTEQEELVRLKELNREMVEAVKDMLWHVDGYDQFKDPIYELIEKYEKARGE